jgi:hypothetical protein
LVGVHKKDGLDFTETDTLWISVTVITFHRHSLRDIKEGMAERTGHDASLASNAQVLVDDDPMIKFRVPMASLGRAHFKAIGFFTVIADHREIDSFMFPLENFNAGTTGIARSGMIDRANEFALTASRALLLIND